MLASTDPQIPHQDLTYLYDSMGNRTRTVENGVVTDYTANNLNQYSQAGGKAFVFDDDGNLVRETVNQSVSSFSFDHDNRLISVGKSSEVWQYAYNALGRLTKRTSGTSNMEAIVDPVGMGSVVSEYDTLSNVTSRHDHGLGLVSTRDGGDNFVGYTFDSVGSVQQLVNANGLVMNEYAYAPFGEAFRSTESISNPLRFVGQFGVRAEPYGHDFMGARLFSAPEGRFTSADPLRTQDTVISAECLRLLLKPTDCIR